MKEETRRPDHRKDGRYEALVARVNADVGALPAPTGAPRRPVVFVVGVPRAGTTLTYQLLAATGAFGYPSNVVARFWRRPGHGARVQRLLEPLLGPPTISYRSVAGRTETWADPHEFGYFFEAHLPFADDHEPTASALGAVHADAFVAELADFEDGAARPLLFKNGLLDFIVPWLAATLPTARFVHVRRPALDNAASLLAIRERYYGDDRAWFSVRPRGADGWRDQPGPEQVAWQIERVRVALDRARDALPGRWTDLDYADVCADPRGAARAVLRDVGVDGDTDGLPERFDAPERALDPDRRRALEQALSARGLR
jgi:hypothetical protein